MSPEDEKAVTLIRHLIGEHFHNYCFQFIAGDSEPYYVYSSRVVGKALMDESLASMESEIDILWMEDDDGEELEETYE